MRRIEIEHRTRYSYPEPVRFLAHKLHVRPREGHDIRIESSSLQIWPAYHIEWQRDVFGNSVAVVTFPEPASGRNKYERRHCSLLRVVIFSSMVHRVSTAFGTIMKWFGRRRISY